MLVIKRIALILAVMAGAALIGAPASAQATRTWVSGVGDDANPCSRTAPCKTFAGSISKTASGGEINCLDPGGFGGLTITKSIQVICDGVQQAGILVSGTNGVVINAPTNSVVILSGLYFDGLGTGTNGVNILAGGTVTIRNSTITGFGNGYGVNLVASSAATNLIMSNVTVTNNGNAATASSGGVYVAPGAGMTATVTINNSRIQNNNSVGFRTDTIGIVGSVINATIDGSVISGNATGVLAKAPVSTGTIKLMITRSTIDENAYGIVGNGVGATVRVGESVISNNGMGLVINASGVVASFGTNMLAGNTTDGAFSGAVVPLK